ncbi:MAG: enoyl-CoA hydratase-related protein [Burkholderiaceae bacterium]|nr:enoyl-CoA hydratase-related protein [Burkholderiaceae bacterium]
MSNDILSRVENRVGYININRPEHRNALVPEALVEFIAAIRAHDRNPQVKVIVVGGVGKSFCSGGDLNFLQHVRTMSPAEVRTVVYEGFVGACAILRGVNKPTIAAVNGPAVGAGCEIAVSCDFRIVSRTAFFSEPWIELGTAPVLGGMFIIPRLIGLERATNMMLRATKIYGEEAKAIGLASEVVDQDALDDMVNTYALDMAKRPSETMSVIKQGLRRGLESTYAAEMDFNLYAQAMLIKGKAHEEGVRALLEKRAPVFD